MTANPSPKSAGRALAWLLLAVATILGVGIPMFRAASQSSTSTNDTTSVFAAYSNSIPAIVLQLFQNQANSPPWNQDSPAKTQSILQRCAVLQQLLNSGATDATVSNALAASTLRASIFMAFGENLHNTGDNHHAEMLFSSVV